jgi:hypothetical protein
MLHCRESEIVANNPFYYEVLKVVSVEVFDDAIRKSLLFRLRWVKFHHVGNRPEALPGAAALHLPLLGRFRLS